MEQDLLFPHTCHDCGQIDEAQFTFAGPHIKQSCAGCGRYVKFVHKHAIPDVREIKLKIWSITQDVDHIDQAKNKSGFFDLPPGIEKKIIYWRLYLAIRQDANNE